MVTKDLVPTPTTQGGNVPNGALISDDDDSFISDAETEGGLGDNNAGSSSGPPSPVSGGALPNEGACGQDSFATDGEGRQRSTQTCDLIDRLVPGATNVRGYPEHVWKSDADGRLECFNLWTFQQSLTKLAKLNQDVFTLTFGSRQIPP